MPAIQEHHHAHQVGAVCQKLFTGALPFSTAGLADFGIPKARKVDQVPTGFPFQVDGKVIDQLGLSGGP